MVQAPGFLVARCRWKKGVLLVMARFKEILDINPVGRRARVQPGVRNGDLEAVAPHNLYYAPDPSSQIACSIGGNVAENAGGVHCLKYGLTVHNLLKIEVQTLDGEALTLGSDALDSLVLTCWRCLPDRKVCSA